MRHRRATALPRPCRAPSDCPNQHRGRCSPSRRPPRRRSSSRRVRNACPPTRPGRHRPPSQRSCRRRFPRFARCAPPTRSPVSPRNSRARASRPPPGRSSHRSNPARSSRRVSPPRSLSRPPAQRSRARLPTRASPKWRSASKPRSGAPTAQKVVAETARVTATVDVKAGTPKAAVQPRGAPPRSPQGNLEQEMASLLSRPGKT